MRFQSGWSYTVLLKYKPKCMTKRTDAQCLLTSLVRTKSQIYMEDIAFTACRFIALGWETVLPVRERDEGRKVGKGRTDTPLGRSFWELFDLFSAPISPMKQRQMFKKLERDASAYSRWKLDTSLNFILFSLFCSSSEAAQWILNRTASWAYSGNPKAATKRVMENKAFYYCASFVQWIQSFYIASIC